MDKMKIGDMYIYPKLKVYNGLLGKFPIRNPDLYLGVEVEAENVANVSHHMVPGSWKCVEDGSLKVHGGEYVTVPIKFQFLETEFRRLFDTIKNATFSCRTSIHVHMNARDMTLQEIGVFLILYSLFEKALYRYSGDRWNNNFCVPIYTAPNFFMVGMLNGLICGGHLTENWSKYHGLNLTPLYGQAGSSERIGTIEFRHMKGNNNVEYILNWCNLISSLKNASKNISVDNLSDLIQRNNINFIGPQVFGKWFDLINTNSYKEDLESCASRVRYLLFKAGILENKYPELPKTKKVGVPDIEELLAEFDTHGSVEIPPSQPIPSATPAMVSDWVPLYSVTTSTSPQPLTHAQMQTILSQAQANVWWSTTQQQVAQPTIVMDDLSEI